MQVLDFLASMPRLCGCENAERKAAIIEWIYRRELDGNSVFDRGEADKADPYLRSEPVAALLYGDEKSDPGAVDQCMRLAHIIEWNHYVTEHGEEFYRPFLDAEYKDAESFESQYPEIADEMNAYEALTHYWSD
jgi:hypothetical protein